MVICMVERVERFGNATLYLGDMREILPTLQMSDAIVTDPPYGIGADEAASKNEDKWGWVDYGKTEWDRLRPEKESFDAIRSKSKHQIIWGGNYFTDFLPPTMQWLIWDKGQRDFSLADFEMAWSSQNKASRIITVARAQAKSDGKEHPTQKSLVVMEWCLSLLPDEVLSVCDPYMGSGTTGVAALKAGKTFIGIEQHETYFDIACRRIEEASKQSSLF
jgi:DNA modification methylase